MKRRDFVIGLGALTAGGAAAVGSGAFTSATASRDMTVEVADDDTGYLALTGDDTYITDDSSDGELGVDLGGTDANNRPEGGEAFNKDAKTVVDGIITVKHQGSDNEVNVEFDGGSEEVDLDIEDNDTGTEAKVTLEFEGDTSLTPGDEVDIRATVDTLTEDIDNPSVDPDVTIVGSDQD